MKKLIIIPLITLSVVFAINYLLIGQKVKSAIEKDERNAGVVFAGNFNHYVNFNVLELNLLQIDSTKSATDVFRSFLQISEVLNSLNFKTVILQYNGEDKFLLQGDYFKKLGLEYSTQNPVYTMRTLPQNLKNLDGSTAYPEWSGGAIGILTKQMDDFSDFNKKWYLEDLIKSEASN